VTPFHADLECHVRWVAYDFLTRTGKVLMDEHDGTDMSGTIELFKQIDPKVSRIEIWEQKEYGPVIDTLYRFVTEPQWVAS
jgi:hypothetical protein